MIVFKREGLDFSNIHGYMTNGGINVLAVAHIPDLQNRSASFFKILKNRSAGYLNFRKIF